ncbi:hypothetical protein HK104_004781 [Borealophlyctis nickersoniae]|nr:hypothetical protein HK104_004781 [Borealophlyctis nickersoniae]
MEDNYCNIARFLDLKTASRLKRTCSTLNSIITENLLLLVAAKDICSITPNPLGHLGSLIDPLGDWFDPPRRTVITIPDKGVNPPDPPTNRRIAALVKHFLEWNVTSTLEFPEHTVNTLLISLSHCGCDNAVNILLSHTSLGPNIQQMESAALLEAAANNHASTCQILLDHGADGTYFDNAPLLLATKNGHVAVMDLLVQRGAPVTPGLLRTAVMKGVEQSVRFLLDHGVDVNADHGTAIQLVGRHRNPNLVRMLIDAGADIHVGVESPLRLAALHGNTEVVRLLLDAGADVHVMLESPLSVAMKEGRKEVVKLLLERGADISIIRRHAMEAACMYRDKDPELRQILLDALGTAEMSGAAGRNVAGGEEEKVLAQEAANAKVAMDQKLYDNLC